MEVQEEKWLQTVENRKKAWIQTYSGIAFFPWDPKPEQIEIIDIAWALSKKNRWNGHLEIDFSVAEHSMNVCDLLPYKYKLAGLLHDASEAYIQDIPSPIKKFLPDYIELEKIIEKAIFSKFNIEEGFMKEVKKVDTACLYMEGDYVLGTLEDKEFEWLPNNLVHPFSKEEFFKRRKKYNGNNEKIFLDFMKKFIDLRT